MTIDDAPKLRGLRLLAWADGHRSWRWLKWVLLFAAQAVVMYVAYVRQVPERQIFGQHRLLAALFLLPAIALSGAAVVALVRSIARAVERRRAES